MFRKGSSENRQLSRNRLGNIKVHDKVDVSYCIDPYLTLKPSHLTNSIQTDLDNY